MTDENSTAEIDVPKTLDQVTESLEETLLGVWSDFVSHIPYLIAGLVVLIVAWILSIIVRRVLQDILERSDLRQSLHDLITRFAMIGVWAMALLLAAMVVFPGLTPASALGGLGLLSVAIGFAFKDIFENFFAGILILWRFPFENGDFIECDGIAGRVERTTIRMTQVRKVTGELVVVPNSILFKTPVNVLTSRPHRRHSIIAGVSYDTNLDQAIETIREAVEACETVERDQPIEIFPQAFGASSIDIEVTWWTGATPLDIRRSQGEVVAAVKRALDEAGIEIPFPYRTLTFKEPLTMRPTSQDATREDEPKQDDVPSEHTTETGPTRLAGS